MELGRATCAIDRAILQGRDLRQDRAKQIHYDLKTQLEILGQGHHKVRRSGLEGEVTERNSQPGTNRRNCITGIPSSTESDGGELEHGPD